MTIEWRVCVDKVRTDRDLSAFEVSNDGRIRRIKNNNEVSQHNNYKGYKVVSLNTDNKSYYYKVHRLVGYAFIDTDDYSLTIDHNNGNKKDNTVENLRWMSREDNAARYGKAILINDNGVLRIVENKHQWCKDRGKGKNFLYKLKRGKHTSLCGVKYVGDVDNLNDDYLLFLTPSNELIPVKDLEKFCNDYLLDYEYINRMFIDGQIYGESEGFIFIGVM